jgi:molecular chaperone DnaJ
VEEKDYYRILGVERNASNDEIRKAYRTLAKKYHPDAHPEDREEAEHRFKEVTEAYEVLKDGEKRAAYDRFGAAGVQGGFSSAGGADFDDIFGESIFGDIFESFFGGSPGGRTRGGRSRAQRGSDIAYQVSITLEEAVDGVERNIEVPRSETCPKCDGSGAAPGTSPITCPSCSGSGQMYIRQGFLTISRTCDRCQGSGRVAQTPCQECRGQGRVRSMRKLKINIPPGADTGLRLRLVGEGELGTAGGPPGDLYVQIAVEQHPVFVRDGDDLLCDLPISFPQAALGAEVKVPTLKGQVDLRIPAGTQNGKVFRLRGKGIPSLRGYGQGDLLVRVLVEIPTKLNKRQKELVQDLAQELGEDTGPLSKSFLDKVKEAFGG